MSNLISIPGMDATTIDKASTAASSGGRPFPCDGFAWTRHTAEITEVVHKVFDNGGENLVLYVQNGSFSGQILISTDPQNVGTATDVEKAVERNLETLVKAVKVIGCHTNGMLDLTKLSLGVGKKITLIAKHKGFRQGTDGKTYHKISLIFTGDAPSLTPVTGPTLPAIPGQAAAAAGPAAAGAVADDIPF